MSELFDPIKKLNATIWFAIKNQRSHAGALIEPKQLILRHVLPEIDLFDSEELMTRQKGKVAIFHNQTI